MNNKTTNTAFSDLPLCSDILQAISDTGYTKPTPIQAEVIPAVLSGKDVMAASQTGSGKTAGFVLPILEKLHQQQLENSREDSHQGAHSHDIRVLILTPTRELAAQVNDSIHTYSKHLRLRHGVVFGGVNINPQIRMLQRGLDILVATPGRLLDLYNQKKLRFSQVNTLVLDEADRMLDMGFIHDIRRLMRALPTHRQTLMFSATFSPEIRKLAKGLLKQPVEISVTPRNSTVEAISQVAYTVEKSKKSELLSRLILNNNWEQVLVFTRTKHGANRLTKFLEKKGIHAAAIHGNKSQGARTKALAHFKSGDIRILVATDIAARGLDINQLPHVVNFDLPDVPLDYVHRIGRTGRAGAKGEAISFVCPDELMQLSSIESLTNQVIQQKTF